MSQQLSLALLLQLLLHGTQHNVTGHPVEMATQYSAWLLHDCYMDIVNMRTADLPDVVKDSGWTALHARCSFTSLGDQMGTIKACAVFTINNGSIPASCTK